jgi:ethanolamine utilization protein EutL
MTGELVDLWPVILSSRQIPLVEPQLAASLGLDPVRHRSAGLVTCDQDDALYVALDHATKFANVDVVFGRSFYAGAKHASGPFSGEVLGIVAGTDPDEVKEALRAVQTHLREVVRFQTFPGGAAAAPAFLAHVIAESGRYLAPEAGIEPGSPMAYLIAPPVEALVAVDAALKASGARLGKLIPPPSETNFAGAFLVGDLPTLEAARDAFIEKIREVAAEPVTAIP